MRTRLLMCMVSAALGAATAVLVTGRPLGPRVAAGEFAQGRVTSVRGPSPRQPMPLFAPPRQPGQIAAVDELTPEERVNVAVYEAVNRSVVNINTKSVHADAFLFFDITAEGSGSGSVLDTMGDILTNLHVVAGAQKIDVTFYNGKSYEATIIGTDPLTDIAVIRTNAPAELLEPVTLGSSNRLKVGQRVFAIGNPFGLERTLTTGIISSVSRSLPVRNHRLLKSVIQIDAAINPGNSGGPLLDTRGRLIGMNMAIASRTGQNSGVGFAIPVDTMARVVPQLIQQGHVIRPDAGISAVYQSELGLRLAQLAPKGPAETAGLRGPRIKRRRRGPFVYESIDRAAADIIVAVDGQRVTTADEMLTLIEKHRAGENVLFTVLRDGREIQIPVRLGQSE